MPLSTGLANKLLDHVFRSTSYTAPANTWIALVTAAGSANVAGTPVSGGSYARVNVPKGDSSWTVDYANSTISNASTVTFPTPSANWGTIVGCELYDASTSGTRLGYGTLTNSKTVNNGDPAPTYPAGSLVIKLT